MAGHSRNRQAQGGPGNRAIFSYHHRRPFRDVSGRVVIEDHDAKQGLTRRGKHGRPFRQPMSSHTMFTRIFGTKTSGMLGAARRTILGLKDVGVNLVRKPTAKERAKYAMKRALGS